SAADSATTGMATRRQKAVVMARRNRRLAGKYALSRVKKARICMGCYPWFDITGRVTRAQGIRHAGSARVRRLRGRQKQSLQAGIDLGSELLGDRVPLAGLLHAGRLNRGKKDCQVEGSVGILVVQLIRSFQL